MTMMDEPSLQRLLAKSEWTDEELEAIARSGLWDSFVSYATLPYEQRAQRHIDWYNQNTSMLGRAWNDIVRGAYGLGSGALGLVGDLTGSPGALAGALALQDRASAVPQRPVLEQLGDAKSFGEALSTAMRDPVGVIAGGALGSIPAMMPAVLATLWSRLRGVAPGIMGATSFMQEYGNEIVRQARMRGIDLADPEVRTKIEAMFADPATMDALRDPALRRGAIVGIFDALSGGIAQRSLVPATAFGGSVPKQEAANLAGQLGAQSALGGGGEALAQLATGEYSPGDIVAETLAEFGSAPLEVATFGRDRIAEQIAKFDAQMQARAAAEKAAAEQRLANSPAAQAAAEEQAHRQALADALSGIVGLPPEQLASWDLRKLEDATARLVRRRMQEMRGVPEAIPEPPEKPAPDAPPEEQRQYAEAMRAYARDMARRWQLHLRDREHALQHEKSFAEPPEPQGSSEYVAATRRPEATIAYAHPDYGTVVLPKDERDRAAAESVLVAAVNNAMQRYAEEQQRMGSMRGLLEKFGVEAPQNANARDLEELFAKEVGNRLRTLAPDVIEPFEADPEKDPEYFGKLRDWNTKVLTAAPDAIAKYEAEGRKAFDVADLYRRRIVGQAETTINTGKGPEPKKGILRDPQAGGEPLGDVNSKLIPVLGGYPVKFIGTTFQVTTNPRTGKLETKVVYAYHAIDPRDGTILRDKDGQFIRLETEDPNEVDWVAYKTGPKNTDFISRAKGPADRKLRLPRAQSRVLSVENMADEAASRGELLGAYELGELVSEYESYGAFLSYGKHTPEIRFGRKTTSGRWYAVGPDQVPKNIRTGLLRGIGELVVLSPDGRRGGGKKSGPSSTNRRPDDNKGGGATNVYGGELPSSREGGDDVPVGDQSPDQHGQDTVADETPDQPGSTGSDETPSGDRDLPISGRDSADNRQGDDAGEGNNAGQDDNQAGGDTPVPAGKKTRAGRTAAGAPAGTAVPERVDTGFVDGNGEPIVLSRLGRAKDNRASHLLSVYYLLEQHFSEITTQYKGTIRIVGHLQQLLDNINHNRKVAEKLEDELDDGLLESGDSEREMSARRLGSKFKKFYGLLKDLKNKVTQALDQAMAELEAAKDIRSARLVENVIRGSSPGVHNSYGIVGGKLEDDVTYVLGGAEPEDPVRHESGLVIERQLAKVTDLADMVAEAARAAQINPKYIYIIEDRNTKDAIARSFTFVGRDGGEARHGLTIGAAHWNKLGTSGRAAAIAHEFGHFILAREQLRNPQAVAELAKLARAEIGKLMEKHGPAGIIAYGANPEYDINSQWIKTARNAGARINKAQAKNYYQSFSEYFANMVMRYIIERSDDIFVDLPQSSRLLIARAAMALRRFWVRFRRFVLGDTDNSATGKAFKEFLQGVIKTHSERAAQAVSERAGSGAESEAQIANQRKRIVEAIDARIAADESAQGADAGELASKLEAIERDFVPKLVVFGRQIGEQSARLAKLTSVAAKAKARENINELWQAVGRLIDNNKDYYNPVRIEGGAYSGGPSLRFTLPAPELEELGLFTEAVVKIHIHESGAIGRSAKLIVTAPPGASIVREAGAHSRSIWAVDRYEVEVELRRDSDKLANLMRERASLLRRMRQADVLPVPEPTVAANELGERLRGELEKALAPFGGQRASRALKHDKAKELGVAHVMSRLGIPESELRNLYGEEDWHSVMTTSRGTEDPVTAAREFLLRLAAYFGRVMSSERERKASRELARKLMTLAGELGLRHMAPFDKIGASVVDDRDAGAFGSMSREERIAFLANQLGRIFGEARDELAARGLVPKKNEIGQVFQDLMPRPGQGEFDAAAQRTFFAALGAHARRSVDFLLDMLEKETAHRDDMMTDQGFAKEQIPTLEKIIGSAERLVPDVDRYIERLEAIATDDAAAGAREAVETMRQAQDRMRQTLARAGERLRELREIAARNGEPPRSAKKKKTSKRASTSSRTETVTTPDGSFEFEVTFEVVSADELKAASGELQPRDRSRAGSQAQIREMAARLDPARLMSSRESDRGAPIVDEQGVVLSGNGRVAAIKLAAKEFPERYASYVAALEEAGYKIKGVDVPVLVRRAAGLTPEQKKTIATKSLAAADLKLSPAEQAMVDAENIDIGMLKQLAIAGEPTTAAFAAAARSFFQAMPPTDRGALMNRDGTLTPAGIERIQAAVFAKAYGDRRMVELMIEERQETGLRNALVTAAADWAAMRELGDDKFDITNNLVEAVHMVRRARTVPGGIKALLGQADAFAQRDHIAELLAQLFYNPELTRLADHRSIAARLIAYTRAVIKRAQAIGDLLGDDNVTPQAILERILNAARQPKGSTLYANPIGPIASMLLDMLKDGTSLATRGVREFGKLIAWLGRPFADTPMVKWINETIEEAVANYRRKDGPGLFRTALSMLRRSTHEHARWYFEQFGSKIAIEKIADRLAPRPGTPTSGQSFEEEVETVGTRFMGKWDRIVRAAREDGFSDEQLADALAGVTRPVGKLEYYRSQLRSLFDEMHAHATEAGVKIGYNEDYLSRVLDPGKVRDNMEDFIEKAASLYRAKKMPDAEARAAAERLAYIVIAGEPMELQPIGLRQLTPTTITRAREFGKDADIVLRDFYEKNLDALGSRYVHSLAKKAAFARRFGHEGAQLLDIVDEIRKELMDKGVDPASIADLEREIFGYVRSLLGAVGTANAWRIVSLGRMWFTLAMLEKAVAASIGEPILAAARSGNALEGMRSLLNTFRLLRRKNRPELLMDAALEAGIIAGDISDAILAQRWFGSDFQGKVEQQVLGAYFRRIGLEQWTNASRLAAMNAGIRFVDRLASTPSRANDYMLRELGISDPERFRSWWSANKLSGDQVAVQAILARFGDNPVARELGAALHRFAADVVISARRGDRPRWANHPIGSIIFQFMSYSFAFGRRVYMRQANLIGAVKKGELPFRAYMSHLLMGLVPALLGLIVVQFGMEELKDKAYGAFDPQHHSTRLTPSAKVERALSRATLFAGYDPLYNAIGAARFERDLGRIIQGPAIGHTIELMSNLHAAIVNNSPKTNTAERQLVRSIYDVFFEPAVNLALTGVTGPFAKVAASATSVYAIPALREPVARAIAGPPQEKKQPIKGVLGRLFGG